MSIVSSSISSSYSLVSTTSDFSILSGNSILSTTSSYSLTSSFFSNYPTIKFGIVSGSLFSGSPKTIIINFTPKFKDTNYVIFITGEIPRQWYVQSKTSGSFIINSNSNSNLSGNVYWQIMR